ncbi:hypothetical protein OIU77_017914 [Salix suchowensis]|uniref:Uncharacterized protein n=1 Tax=Salix suchowensis TaxID=1278906 RepID=A0ABQ8ZQJ6_9ROSI|nr:hypothetical protein OIU77_017914 [Salix suchowensis]KAJ6316708.1 hypothetical protein OIU78_019900 [Salix suchowensis]
MASLHHFSQSNSKQESNQTSPSTEPIGLFQSLDTSISLPQYLTKLLIHIFLGSVPCVVASTPETAKLFLRTHENSFRDRPKCSDNDDEADGARNLVHEVAELTGKFNLSDFIWFCKNLDLQGFGKKLKEVHERIIKEHGEVRKIKKETGEGDPVKNLLYILLDISEDGSSEMKLTRDNIMAFILVKSISHKFYSILVPSSYKVKFYERNQS